MSGETTFQGLSGREASRLRRRLLSQGKAALPAATERVRSGFREAAMPNDAPSQPPEAPVSVPRDPASPPPKATGGQTGRAASIERRKSLSQGKGALPPASERIRSGFREADLPVDSTAAATAGTAPAPQGGREASVARRSALSLGKAGLPPAKERVRSGFREAEMPADVARHAATGDQAGIAQVATPDDDDMSGKEKSRQIRAHRAKYGRGDAPQSGPCRPSRKGEMSYPPKVPEVRTALAGASVTGLSYAAGRGVTGAEAGRDKPLTGTQYVGGTEGSYRSGASKVGHALTSGGQTVSGTMVRSGVRITGDEDSTDVRVTGNADQSLTDVEGTGEGMVPVAAQFARQSQPHGASVFGTNLGRSARSVGSRSRDTERPVEQTEGGLAVSGTAIGRSTRVTGDEQGALRSLTGSQYLAPGSGQDTALPEDGRADPVSGGKVTQSQTWGGQTVTGPEMEHDTRVTGSEHGSCQTLTGTPYYGASGAHGWCDPATAEAEGAARARHVPRAVTGDVPLHDPKISGTGRGAERGITGSSYFVSDERHPDTGDDRVAHAITGFSVSSPQRAAHMRSRVDEPPTEGFGASPITGTFAQGEGKVTGNVEFNGATRAAQPGIRPARNAVTGEGATRGCEITGSAWGEHNRVTGTEDYVAATRNPSQRQGGTHGFAGARTFKSKAPGHDPVSPVTGATGGTPSSGATVTLSGGAAG